VDKLKYAKLTEMHNRMKADLLESYLEAHGIDVELFQESVGHTAFPVTVDGLGLVQVFVPGEKLKQAEKLFEEFNEE
jgi:hypothetical protein